MGRLTEDMGSRGGMWGTTFLLSIKPQDSDGVYVLVCQEFLPTAGTCSSCANKKRAIFKVWETVMPRPQRPGLTMTIVASHQLCGFCSIELIASWRSVSEALAI